MAWIWFCTYDKGHGLDREACPGRSRKLLKTKEAAYAGGLRHARKPGYYFGRHEHFDCVIVREVDGRSRKQRPNTKDTRI